MKLRTKRCLSIACMVCIVIISVLTFPSCYTEVTRTAYLEDANIQGQVNVPPLHITSDPKAGKITFSPHISISQNQGVTTNVEADTYDKTSKKTNSYPSSGLQINSTMNTSNTALYPSGPNLRWDIAKACAGTDAEVYFSDNISIMGSINFSMGSKYSYTDGAVGLAYFSDAGSSAIRLEGGLLFNSFRYEAYTEVVETISGTIFSHSTTNTYYYYDRGIASSLDYYFAFTLNSDAKNSLLNYFFQLSYFQNSILDYYPNGYDPGHYVNGLPPYVGQDVTNKTGLKSTACFLGLYPGIYFNLTNNMRFDLGARILYATNLDSDKVNIWPAVQFDITF